MSFILIMKYDQTLTDHGRYKMHFTFIIFLEIKDSKSANIYRWMSLIVWTNAINDKKIMSYCSFYFQQKHKRDAKRISWFDSLLFNGIFSKTWLFPLSQNSVTITKTLIRKYVSLTISLTSTNSGLCIHRMTSNCVTISKIPLKIQISYLCVICFFCEFKTFPVWWQERSVFPVPVCSPIPVFLQTLHTAKPALDTISLTQRVFYVTQPIISDI